MPSHKPFITSNAISTMRKMSKESAKAYKAFKADRSKDIVSERKEFGYNKTIAFTAVELVATKLPR